MEKLYDVLGLVKRSAELANRSVNLVDSAIEKAHYSIGRHIPKGARDIIIEYRDVAWCSALAICIPAVQDPLLLLAAYSTVQLETACEMTETVEREKRAEENITINKIVEQEEKEPEEKEPEVRKPQNSTPYPAVKNEMTYRCVISIGESEDYALHTDTGGGRGRYDAAFTAEANNRTVLHTINVKRGSKVLKIQDVVDKANETGVLNEQRIDEIIKMKPDDTPSNGLPTMNNSTKNTRRQSRVAKQPEQQTDPQADTQLKIADNEKQ